MVASKLKKAFVCEECGAEHSKWQGKCHACGAWNSLREFVEAKNTRIADVGYSGTQVGVQLLGDVTTESGMRLSSGYTELDRVLGGGLVQGSVILIGGDPGAGKSTLLLQVAAKIAKHSDCLYVSGEESMQQIAERARRLQIQAPSIQLASVTSVEQITNMVIQSKPAVVIVDSIQVMQTNTVESLAGSVTQVRESAACLTQLAKQTNTAMVLVGHVTKEGNLAGPKVLEHIIDCFVMLDAPVGSRYRTLRSIKNRFGAVNELGVFAMSDHGLKEVRNPSAIFLERSAEPGAGSVITVIWEGTRPLLVEIQALVDDVQGGYPRRVAVGLDPQRLSMQLAVMHRHCGLSLANDDVFANVTGGVRVGETATDLALICAVYSSFRSFVLPRTLVVFGEMGLTGEIRPVPNGQERLREAAKHGFTQAIVPFANRPQKPIAGMDSYAVKTLAEALDTITSIVKDGK